MKAWWDNLKVREQALVAVVSLVAIFVIIDGLILEEFRLKQSQLDEQVTQAREDLEWMRQAVNSLPTDNKQKERVLAGRIVSYVDQQISRQGLKNKMQQMTPVQDHSVRLRLQDIQFDKLLNFLVVLDGSVLIQEVRILPADQKGHVNVSLMVSNGTPVS